MKNKLATNKLATNKLATNKLATNKLATNKLATNKFQLSSAGASDLLATADGREVLGFIVSCALPIDVTLVAKHNNETFEFPGEIGLTPQWLHQRLGQAGKGWISACLFARANALDVALPISMRGPHRALRTDADERASWPLEEGAFYGNLFTPGNDPPDWWACRGRDQRAGEFGGLVDRDCAEPDPANPGKTLCGLNYAGDCGQVLGHVCKKFNNSKKFYKQCIGVVDDNDDDDDDDDDDDGNGCHKAHHRHHHHQNVYRQVITVFTVQ
ncbi:MAG: hypothetical protein KF773_29575 [Deltaproteobacteria bacterium]|nr:hypothetical protein [Deltaproteobacteria bacterium]MCW5806999.1 hypothetical protein [Deltaproteobacteria bacterium]